MKSTAVVPAAITEQRAAFHMIALYGAPSDVVDRYGRRYDAANYSRAMADEFARSKYKASLQRRIDAGVAQVRFDERFTLQGEARLGEYDFATQSFPINDLPTLSLDIAGFANEQRYGPEGTPLSVFDWQLAVNSAEFSSALPMPEVAASALVKSFAPTNPDRRVHVRIVYGLTNRVGLYAKRAYPFIYSVEVFRDSRLTRKLADIHRVVSNVPRPEQWAAAALAAQTPARTIGTFPYLIFLGGSRWTNGTVTISDVGITLSEEGASGPAQPTTFFFYNGFAVAWELRNLPREQRPMFGGNRNLDTLRISKETDNGTGYSRPAIGFHFPEGSTSAGVIRFGDADQRDRVYDALLPAMRAWVSKYPAFATTPLAVP